MNLRDIKKSNDLVGQSHWREAWALGGCDYCTPYLWPRISDFYGRNEFILVTKTIKFSNLPKFGLKKQLLTPTDMSKQISRYIEKTVFFSDDTTRYIDIDNDNQNFDID